MYRYDLTCRSKDIDIEPEWETGFETYDDAYDAMSERITEIIDDVAEKHPEFDDQEIEDAIDWDVRED